MRMADVQQGPESSEDEGQGQDSWTGPPGNLHSQQVPSDWGSAVTTTFKKEMSSHLARIWGSHQDGP